MIAWPASPIKPLAVWVWPEDYQHVCFNRAGAEEGGWGREGAGGGGGSDHSSWGNHASWLGTKHQQLFQINPVSSQKRNKITNAIRLHIFIATKGRSESGMSTNANRQCTRGSWQHYIWWPEAIHNATVKLTANRRQPSAALQTYSAIQFNYFVASRVLVFHNIVN